MSNPLAGTEIRRNVIMNYPQNVYDPSEKFILEAKAFLQHFPKCCDISMTHRLDYKSLKYDSAEFQQNSKIKTNFFTF